MIPVCVAPDLIDQFWPHVVSLIQSAFWCGRGDDDENVVYDDLKNQRSLLWVVWDEDSRHVAAAVTTKLVAVPRGKVCLITSCAGNHIDKWLHFLTTIEQYARDEGCKYIRFTGRRGWTRHFRDWHEPWVTLEKVL